MIENNKAEELTDSLKKYLNTNSELIKLELTERSIAIGTHLISGLLIGMFAVLFIVFISIWAGCYISILLGDNYSGFAIVAGFYFLLCLILLIGKKNLVEIPIRDKVITKVFSKL